MSDQTNEVNEQEENFVVNDLPTFVGLLSDWHQHQVQTILHIRDVPEGITVKIEDAEDLVLEGDKYRAFRAGLEVALTYLGKLPFNPMYDEDSDEARESPVH